MTDLTRSDKGEIGVDVETWCGEVGQMLCARSTQDRARFDTCRFGRRRIEGRAVVDVPEQYQHCGLAAAKGLRERVNDVVVITPR